MKKFYFLPSSKAKEELKTRHVWSMNSFLKQVGLCLFISLGLLMSADLTAQCNRDVKTTSDGASIAGSGVQGICLFCSVTGENNLIDENTSNKASINIPVGVFGTGYVDVNLGETYPAGTRAGFVADVNGGVAGLFNGVTLTTYLGGQQQQSISGGSLVNILGFGGGRNVAAIFCKPFDRIRFKGGSLAGVLANYSIHYAFVEKDCPYYAECGIAPPPPPPPPVANECTIFAGFDEYEVENGSLLDDNPAFTIYQGGSANGLSPLGVQVIGFSVANVYVLAPDGSIDEYDEDDGTLADDNAPFAAFSGGTANGISPQNANFIGASEGLVYVQGPDGTIDGYRDGTGALADDNGFSFSNAPGCLVGVGRDDVYILMPDGSIDEFDLNTGIIEDDNLPIIFANGATPSCSNIIGEEGDELVFGCGQDFNNGGGQPGQETLLCYSFNVGTEGWIDDNNNDGEPSNAIDIQNSSVPTTNAGCQVSSFPASPGGNYIVMSDLAGGDEWFLSPNNLNLSVAGATELSFWILDQAGSGATKYTNRTIRLRGAGTHASANFSGAINAGWQLITLPLNAATWGNNINAILNDLDRIEIRIENIKNDNNGSCATIEYYGLDELKFTKNGVIPALDTDNDGVPNDQDVDDDNDGIFDIVEGGGQAAKEALFAYSFNNGIAGWADDNNNDGLGGGAIRLQNSSVGTTNGGCSIAGLPNSPGGNYIVFKDDVGGTEWFVSPNNLNQSIAGATELSFYLLNGTFDGTGDLDKANRSIRLRGAGTHATAQFTGAINAGWQLITLPLNAATWGNNITAILNDLDRIEIVVENVNSRNGGNCGTDEYMGLDEIQFTRDAVNAVLDTDNDGIPNALDLDSDNDGCSDANEYYNNPTADGGDDGRFGIGTPAVDAQGLVITATYVGDYTNVINNAISITCFFNDNDNDGIVDQQDLDDDNDGITDVIEASVGGGDTDGDGIPNAFDLDSDNDGINDVIEADGVDNNGDGIADGAVGTAPNTNGIPSTAGLGLTPPDTDGDGIVDHSDLDSDNDTVSDLIEGGSGAADVDDNGVADGPDADQDGIVDDADGNDAAFGDANDPKPVDTDGEGTPDYLDPDSDDPADNVIDNTDGENDDIDAAGNTPLDADQDGLVDNDDDVDDDGIADVVDEDIPVFGGLKKPAPALPDADNDGIPDVDDLDDDNDGITDAIEASVGGGDTDGDGIPNSLDLDSDNDGINDVIEADGIDANGDGIADGAVGNLPTTNGIPASAGTGLLPPDTDGDGIVDHSDLDSDNDTISDLIEGGSGATDADDNGVADGPDADQDGIVDSADGNDAVFGDANDPAPVDTDGEGTPDFRDPDSDDQFDNIVDNTDGANDDIDAAGNTPLDADQDGLVDNDDDVDQDGIADVIDDDVPVYGGLGAPNDLDTDGDGIPDVIDTDDDNDGVNDSDEALAGTDPLDPETVDGTPDGSIDTDGDGINNGDESDEDLAVPTDKNPADGKPDIITALVKNIDLFPNYTFGNTTYNVGDMRMIVININEILGDATDGSNIQVFVPFSAGFTYEFDPAQTLATVIAPESVNNPDWSVMNTGTGFLFSTTKVIPGGARSRIAIKVTGDVPATVANITANIVPGSGGEIDNTNNISVLAKSIQH